MNERTETIDASLSNTRSAKAGLYAMSDQTFHTPSFGDEEFDIPLIHGQHANNGGAQNSHIQYTQMHHAAPQVGMMNPAQDGLAPPGGAPSYQQPLYLQEPHTPVTTHSGAVAPSGNYMIQQQPGGQQQLLMLQPTQVMSGPPTPSTPTQQAPVYGSPQRASPPGTTSDDSDDSVPSQHSQLPGDAESLLPIHYCSASRQQQTALHQMNMTMGVKRSSPEPMDNGINRGQMQKKPKVQKKKKKRDPNEPQKPVSAYALFFRDTQAAIKGQNPNASFGEVSKIVASMWDGLDSEHKSVYKQKTEVAKKEYLKALAAYRASLVSKGSEQDNQVMFNHNNTNTNYGNYYQGQGYGNGHSPQGFVPNATPQGYSPQNYPGGQPQTTYAGQQPQGYPNNPQQSPQNYQGNIGHPGQSYQGVPGQPPQNYQVNPAASPQNCQPNMTQQSPRNYQPTQSPPNYAANAGLSPPNYRQVQSQSPPMANVHAAMQYHHSQQMQQAHQVQQYQQQPQQNHQQTQQQQNQNPQQHQQQQQQLHQQQQQQHHQQQQQQQLHQQQSPQQQQAQNQAIKSEPHTNNNNAASGIPQQSTEQSETNTTTSCVRQGCTNPAIANSEWENEYCSNECVVSHCRDVFSSWVASNTNNQMQNFSAVK
ncbi:TOX high mobility group box family member 3-like isoform X2 [Colias croceus]|uniref:TOX high mobility group box family member 3-like isoform X2 n=1 Tax=Colias crocea TaxID=72248 RepID=UPI001E27BA6D|nr:TOX high mobility group box family member 3-like isoform X2 [Colias croceus]